MKPNCTTFFPVGWEVRDILQYLSDRYQTDDFVDDPTVLSIQAVQNQRVRFNVELSFKTNAEFSHPQKAPADA